MGEDALQLLVVLRLKNTIMEATMIIVFVEENNLGIAFCHLSMLVSCFLSYETD